MDVGFFTRKMANDLNPLSQGKIAIQEESRKSWTYSDLHRISNTYANKLSQLGVRKGDCVGILLYNCLEYFGLYFAAAKIGAVAVRLNFRLSSAELEYALNDSQTKILCFHSNLSQQMEPILHQVSVERFICLENSNEVIPSWSEPWSVLESGSADEVNVNHIKLSDPVMLMYTSGTTGRPKGAIWTHNTTYWFSAIQALKWKFTGKEIGMTTGPLYHVGAMEDIALPIMMMGGTVIITKSQGFKIGRILSIIERENVTDCFLFPFMIYEMLNYPELGKYQLKALKTIYTGGDPLMPWALEQLKNKYPHLGVVQVYGLTEGQPIAAALDAVDNFTKGHTVGKPMPLTEINIIDDNGMPLPVGEIGEIAIKSPGVSEGYWRKPEATMETFVNGWCKTGDLGVFDQDGYLSIAGRKKDMIRSGGENIYAAEIEDVLYRHQDVKEVCIIGIPDPKYIEAVCAVIVKKEGSNLMEEDVIDFCKQYLASYKKPREVRFVDEIPRTPSGKVQKYILRKQFSEVN
ncbi:class I adenylate-forming enzyme family protein [Schinkia azotoformans]|uniref:class I adenylate-forming enzyme family protein n=1 Tax=Schinkia azotoformans TaxID=1454 RepID=UPI002DB91957|nr:AMP-binding protein [Schinkia azotoformans]MEC1718440.1 AMP-binding protein [Schinkia azotoformans]MEC1743022.1 AMP-binding protein [Schinkia azotoformans]MEC1744079.1 AMP-binding protein [Schinkia azotoformans]MEC1765493.1 AMP-binding protein [Schinkia azotoformans]MEC1772319.1 AMP-binding protein [Schinkia azotoformans]